jgi:3-hydroxybutyryl-CoA dehydrogenase
MTEGCVLVIGAGRMGRGIAQSYALAGQEVILVDLKRRSAADFESLAVAVKSDIEADLQFTVELGYLDLRNVAVTLARISTITADEFDPAATPVAIAYEALPETLELKQQAFSWANNSLHLDTVIASTTSTLDVNELAELVDKPERFLNAHWLNPAHLMPLVEVAVGDKTSDASYQHVHESLQSIGKVPVKCAASPGYIVPRIQALAMNEAARLIEEGVATAEDVDTAVRVGFGLRFAVLGLLEFIDWGGNDILYHASKHMSRTVDENRYRAPDIVEENMRTGRNGLREQQGFYDYEKMDVDKYRREKLGRFLDLVEYSDLLPSGLARRKK